MQLTDRFAGLSLAATQGGGNAARRCIAYLLQVSERIDSRTRLLLGSLGFLVRPVADVNLFLAYYPRRCDGVVLVDVGTEHGRGMVIVERIFSQLQDTPVIPLCTELSLASCRQYFKVGAADVLDKALDDHDLARALLENRPGPFPLQPLLPLQRYRRIRFASLTAREREVFSLLLRGMSTRQISSELALSSRTIDIYRSHIKKKLKVQNLAQMAWEYGRCAK